MRTPLLAAPVVALALLPAIAAARGEHPEVRASAALDHSIVLDKSIGGIPLGITPSQIERRLGKPSHVIRVGGKIAELDFRRVGIDAQFDTLHRGDPANFLTAETSAFHTSRGIHPGSTVAALRRAYGRDGLRRNDGLNTLYEGRPGAIGSSRADFPSFRGTIEDIDIQTVFNDG